MKDAEHVRAREENTQLLRGCGEVQFSTGGSELICEVVGQVVFLHGRYAGYGLSRRAF